MVKILSLMNNELISKFWEPKFLSPQNLANMASYKIK